MLEINDSLEQELLNTFKSNENKFGLGKIIINEDYNETLVTNGKSLITYINLKLEESLPVSDEERLRIVTLSRKLIKQRANKDSLCEIYLKKKM